MSLRPGGGGGGGRKGGGGDRTGTYKKSVDMVEARRRREEGFVEIRKNKRGDSLSRKRRELASSSAGLDMPGPHVCRQHAAGISPQFMHDELEKITVMAERLWSEDFVEQTNASKYFAKVLAVAENPPIDLVIRAGIVPHLVKFLLRKDQPALQFEAAWSLTNVASGTSEQTQVVVDHGAVPNLLQLLSSPWDEIREQAVWALGNIAGDSFMCRDTVLASGAMIPLISLLNPQSKLSMIRNVTWTLSNLCRGQPSPQFDQVKPALSVLPRLVYSNDDDILINASSALAYLFDEASYEIQDFMDTNMCARFVRLLNHPAISVQIAALRALTNISAGDDTRTQLAIDNGALPCLLQLLIHHRESNIRRLACRAISNIAAGNKPQVQAVIDSNVIPPLVGLLKEAESEVQREVAWVIHNATSEGTFEQIHFIAKEGCIGPLCDLLGSPDAEAVWVSLEALENVLKVGEAEKELGGRDGSNVYAQEVEDCGGLARIEGLQLHPHATVSHAATRMLESYWEQPGDEGLREQAEDGEELTEELRERGGGGAAAASSSGEDDPKRGEVDLGGS